MNSVKMSDVSYPQSWYPLCRSADLRRGQVIRQQALGIPLAVLRTTQNRVTALHALCSHMGADLSRGCVVGERLQCPLHHWEYGVNGVCEHIPRQDQIPIRARQVTFPCEEHYGLVFAFIGGEPVFAFPRFASTSSSLGGETMHSRPSITDIEAAPSCARRQLV
jgi:phenylpropionate dioxygenase-like ring-hydroxylating dioxygenase large terminal subunit